MFGFCMGDPHTNLKQLDYLFWQCSRGRLVNLRPDLWSWRRGLSKSGLRTSIRQDPRKIICYYTMVQYLLASPTAVREPNSFCRSVSACFSGRLPWYTIIVELHVLKFLGGIIENRLTLARRHVVASFKILFLLKLCTWWKCVSSPFHPEYAKKNMARTSKILQPIF